MNSNAMFTEEQGLGSGISDRQEEYEGAEASADRQLTNECEDSGSPAEPEPTEDAPMASCAQLQSEHEGAGATEQSESGENGTVPFRPVNVEAESGDMPTAEKVQHRENQEDGGLTTRPGQREERKRPRGGMTGKILALALCCALLGGGAGAGIFALCNGSLGGSGTDAGTARNTAAVLPGQRESTVLEINYVDTGKELTAAEIYAANVNSTVGITTSVTTNYFGYQTTSAASGSGFILTENGYIVTNYHVVEDAGEIKVTTYDDTVYEAELIGYDESNDLAILKVDAEALTPVVLGDSDNMNVGDSVVAIGNPLGELTFSLTSGTVSALNRKVTISSTAMTLIQTDCAINSGNSGGALFNSHGEVVGITNAKYSGSGSSSAASIDNIGFAIPINSVKESIESIIEKGYIMKPYIGVSVYELDSSYRMFGLSGVVVQNVEENSPAAAAGLTRNDIIRKVNGTEISGISEFKSIIAGGNEGDILTLTIYRQGETLEIEVKLAMLQQSVLTEDSSSASSQQEQTGRLPYSGGGFFGQ